MKRISFIAAVCAVLFLTAFALVVLKNNTRTTGLSHSNINRGEDETIEASHALEAMRWYNDQRAYPFGDIPLNWREQAKLQLEHARLSKVSSVNSIAWSAVGPASGIGGRVRSLAVDPANTNTLYCGSVSGGVWKTTNSGGAWFPLTDFEPNLIIGALAIDPINSNIIYAGTGEGYFNVDAFRGIGILKSTDGGGSWTVLNNFVGASAPYYYYYINKIVIRPDNPNIIFAALSSREAGVWRSTDAGATWNKLAVPSSSKFCTDLALDPSNFDILYASFGLFTADAVYKTSNASASSPSWTKLSNGWPSPGANTNRFNRVSIAISHSNGSILYAAISDSNYYTYGIYKTTNGGARWDSIAKPTDGGAVIGTYLGGQGWYNNVIAVHPTNPNIVYAGGINVFRSTNGGFNWVKISDGYAGGIHVDQHAIAFDPTDANVMYFGNDGGVFRSANGGINFSNINNQLAITQFYSGATHPTAEIYYGGTQDNGTLRSAVLPAWSMVFGGDGGVTWVDYNNPALVYSEYVYLSVQKSVDGGTNWLRATNGIPMSGSNQSDGTTERCSFIAPIAMDPNNPQVLIAGTYHVYRTTNGGTFWSSISGDITGDGPGAVATEGSVITALAISKSSPPVIYAGTSGSTTATGAVKSVAKVVVGTTANNGAVWNFADVTKTPLPNRYVRGFAIDPANASRAYVVFSGYGSGHVFVTTDGGTAWSDVSGDLPNIPVNAIIIDPASANHLVIGTDLGVFESANGGVNWSQQNSGMANAPVADLDLRGDGYLFAATHGRGMFKSTSPLGTAIATGLTIIAHQNTVLSQFLDLYVTAQDSLSAAPSMRAALNGGSNQPIPLQQNSYRVFRGSYQLTSSGALVLNVSASDSLGHSIATSRTLQTQLVKAGVGGNVAFGGATLSVPAGAVDVDQYFTAQKNVLSGQIPGWQFSNVEYEFGPAREFSAGIIVSLPIPEGLRHAVEERSLTVYRKTAQGWAPLSSWIDTRRNTVTTTVSSLGTFALGEGSSGASQFLPVGYRLEQNYPNPFNPQTSIRFVLPEGGNVSLGVFNTLGQEIRSLVNEYRPQGIYSERWNAANSTGVGVSSGIYFYRLVVKSGGEIRYQATGKMLLVK